MEELFVCVAKLQEAMEDLRRRVGAIDGEPGRGLSDCVTGLDIALHALERNVTKVHRLLGPTT